MRWISFFGKKETFAVHKCCQQGLLSQFRLINCNVEKSSREFIKPVWIIGDKYKDKFYVSKLGVTKRNADPIVAKAKQLFTELVNNTYIDYLQEMAPNEQVE